MKQRLNKLLAVVLAASLCIPAIPADTVQAADAGTVFTEEEQILVGSGNKEQERSTVINDGWKFHLGDISGASGTGVNDADWNNVDLPHDFSITQDFTATGEAESGFLPGGTGWYRKHMALSEALAGKRLVLNFDGVYSHAEVYVNGTKVGEHHYGYTSFAFDITDYVVCDGSTDNIIAVKAVNNVPSSRWYSGSGIYRDVKLLVTDPVHVALNGTHVTTPMLKESNGKDGTVNTAVEVLNDSNAPVKVTVRNLVFEKNGSEAVAASEKAVDVAAGASETVTTEAFVSEPKLWSLDSPNLYYVRTEILQGTSVLDSYDSEFGFKWYEFVGNEGFKLNGRPVKINGVCMHHDQGALGSAAYHDAVYRQMSIMKDMGTNTIRITHNPGAEVLVDVCNELGLLVIEEAFDGWAWAKNGNINDFSTHFTKNLTDDNQIIGGSSSMTWAEFVIKSMVKRDRNDASVILWSLGNEIDEGSGGGPWNVHADNLIRWTKEVDTTHPVTSGSNRRTLSSENDTGVPIVNQKVYESGGVPGYNYGDIGGMNTMHSRYPVILWSETASAINSRSVYTDQSTGAGAKGGHLTSYDESCVGWGKTAHDSMWPTLTTDWIAGECVWTGFDYIGEPTPWNGTGVGIHQYAPDKSIAAPNSSYFGIVETTGFPKDNYYLYRSQWNQKDDTLHLVTAWDSDNMKQSNGKTPVWVYSNAAKVVLYLNDTPIGTAVRKDVSGTTTDMGHVHYEYTTTSENSSVCTTSSGTGSTSLYSVFNVAFEEGTLSAKAYDENNNEITEKCKGRTSVSTPGEPAKLKVSQDKKEILADGSSLVYISVDVTDANDNPDTTASNDIRFELSGNGEILGVDNGDQATVDKYQQASVIESKTAAHIKAYAGKALVIARSTTRSGGFSVDVSSDGLEGDTVEVATKLPGGRDENEIESYRMARHCYVPAGADAVALPEKVSVVRLSGKEEEVNVAWGNYDKKKLQQAGTFIINGTIGSGNVLIPVSITVHVYGNIVAAKNVSAAVAPNMMPVLPTALMTYAEDGTEFESFPVTWEMDGITSEDFAEVGSIKTIKGTVTASYINKTFPVTANVRVAEARAGEITNIAPVASDLSQNCAPTSDNLLTVNDENRYGDQATQSSRWTDWDDARADKATNPPAITMKWDTVHEVNEIRLYYAIPINGVAKPKNVTIKLSADGINFTEMGYAEPTVIPAVDGESTEGASFKLNESTTPIAVQVVLERDGDNRVGLTEIEVMSSLYVFDTYDTAELDGIMMGGAPLDGFTAGKADYVVDSLAEITGQSDKNVAITVLPEYNGLVTLLTSSEDGKSSKVYTVSRKVKEEEANAVIQEINSLKALDSSKYTKESYDKLMQVIQKYEGRTLTELSAKELIDFKKELNEAKNALEAAPIKPDPEPSKPGPQPDPGTQQPTPNPPAQQPALKKGQTKKSGNVQYKVLNASKKTVAAAKIASKKATKITIPATVTVNGVSCKVTEISANAFKGAGKLKSITIGKNVTTIGKNAFQNCKVLNKVTFKGTAVKTIKKGAFKSTNKKITVTVPKSMKKAKKDSFKKKLTDAGMSKNVKMK